MLSLPVSYDVGVAVAVRPLAGAADALDDGPLGAADLLAKVALRLQAVAVHVLGHVAAQNLNRV